MSRLDRISTRDAFGEALLQIAKENENVFAIGADTTKSMGMAQMAKAFPQRVVNNGIAEQNMMALAAGVATCGYQVYAASYARLCPCAHWNRCVPSSPIPDWM